VGGEVGFLEVDVLDELLALLLVERVAGGRHGSAWLIVVVSVDGRGRFASHNRPAGGKICRRLIRCNWTNSVPANAGKTAFSLWYVSGFSAKDDQKWRHEAASGLLCKN
jgi:hypothetical protein